MRDPMAVSREIVPPPGAAGAEPHSTVRAGSGWRRAVAIILVVLLGLLAPLGAIAGWARSTLLDTDRYVETVAPLASETAIRDFVADAVTDALSERIDPAQVPADQIASSVDAAVHSDRFPAVWEEANRLAHGQLVALLTGERVGAIEVTEGTVTLDVSAIVTEVVGRLAGAGYPVAVTQGEAPVPVTIVKSDDVGRVQELVDLLDRLAPILLAATLLALAAALLVAPNRWRAVRWSGIALAIGAVVVLAGLVIGRFLYLDALGDALPRDAASALFDVLARFLWIETIVLLLVGLVAILVGVMVEHRTAPGARSG